MSSAFAKVLTSTDLGVTGSHQGGICIPRKDNALLTFFPFLDPQIVNPDTWIKCVDLNGKIWRMRYIYYNGKLHNSSTRNEYRITHMSTFFKEQTAKVEDSLVFTATDKPNTFNILLERHEFEPECLVQEPKTTYYPSNQPRIIKLRGWRKVH